MIMQKGLTDNIHTVLRRLSGKEGLVILDQAVVSGGNFLLGILLARTLGLHGFGVYSLLWMGILFTLNLHQSYLTQPMMSLFPGKQERAAETYLQSLFLMQVMISAISFAGSLSAGWWLNSLPFTNEWVAYLPDVFLFAGLCLMQDFLRKLFFLRGAFRYPLYMDVVLYLLLAGLLWLKNPSDLETAFWIISISYGLSCLTGLMFLFLKETPGLLKNIDYRSVIQTAKDHYHFSFWLLGTSLVQWFSGNYFLIVSAEVLGTMALGALRMAQNMVGLCHVIFLGMENILPAEAARHFLQDGRPGLMAFLKKSTLAGLIPVVLLLLFLTLGAPWLIDLLFGPAYVPYSALVGGFAILYIFVYLGYPLRYAFRTLQFTSPIFIGSLISSLASIVLAFPMIQTWGLNGVLSGLVLLQIIVLAVYLFFLKIQTTPDRRGLFSASSYRIH